MRHNDFGSPFTTLNYWFTVTLGYSSLLWIIYLQWLWGTPHYSELLICSDFGHLWLRWIAYLLLSCYQLSLTLLAAAGSWVSKKMSPNNSLHECKQKITIMGYYHSQVYIIRKQAQHSMWISRIIVANCNETLCFTLRVFNLHQKMCDILTLIQPITFQKLYIFTRKDVYNQLCIIFKICNYILKNRVDIKMNT